MFYLRSPSTSLIKRVAVVCTLLAAAAAYLMSRQQVPVVSAQAQPNTYKNFESPQVHPLAVTPDGTRLLAVNSPNGTLSVFHLTGNKLTLMAEIPVGLEPVSVRARNDREAWVTNWLSDSVSVVDLSTFNVTRTFDVGDEPTDVVFAGQQRELAFVCVSGLSQIKVYDPAAPTAAPQVLDISGKQPRSLQRDASGARVFVSVFESGNGTTIVPAAQVSAGGGPPAPSPAMAANLPAAPAAGLIVKWNGAGWVDERNDARWSQFIPYTLADNDVVVIEARSASPLVSTQVRGVGTHMGNAAIDTAANRLYVLNDEAHNETRFEPNVRGRFLSTRVSIIDFGGSSPTVAPVDLNQHINYSEPAGSDAERALSLALPSDIVRGADGLFYVAATGSTKVGVLDATGAVQARINVGQGPTGLALNPRRKLLYVLNRFDETLSIVDLNLKSEIASVPVGFNPEPQSVRQGRRFMYDASLSAHGDLSCASCHFNGHRDGLAWDLGDPQGQMQQVTSPFPSPILQRSSNFHPMKGPMTTQSLRGLTATEPLHWRGDRANLFAFDPAFVTLLGGPRQLSPGEMAQFNAFVQTLTYPPNPLQNLDRTLPNPPTGPSAARGAQLFNNALLDGNLLSCNQCHASSANGPGTDRAIIQAALLQESQDFKVPQLRGLYQKTGMRRAAGEQLAAYGFAHDGSFDTLLNFLRSPVFTFRSDNDRRDVEQFVLAFDTGIAPAVGLQVTVNSDNKNSAAVAERINLLLAQASRGNCDLVVRGKFKGFARGFVHVGNGMFQPDRQTEPQASWQTLIEAVEPGAELTFTGVPLGAGRRFGVDRDDNGTLDNDEPRRPNAIDSSDLFVWQHYVDFLDREPDDDGLAYWISQIDLCQPALTCTGQRRNGVSAAFFVENEFQQTGYFVYRLYKASLGRQPAFSEFVADRRRVVDGPDLEANRQALVNDWVGRPAFTAANAYPSSLTPAQFVNKLFDTAGLLPYSAERQQQIDAMNTSGKTRAQVLRDVIEMAEFKAREYNPAFVRMQYFGYLRRDPDPGGEAFWLDVVNNHATNNYRAMVCAFLTSTEYQQRFGSSVTRTNADCAAP
jgi:YVTN family beta-propeller protein